MLEKIGEVTLNYQYYKGQDLYSDGPIEDHILEICKSGRQKDALKDNPDWATLYHLSSARKNILDWYPMKKNATVLEIGAGCGAITGVLSKKAERVVCIELSKRRSLINAYQNQSCSNVEIYVGKYEDIQLEEKFDYITLIGVLEYAAYYTSADNPYVSMLEQIQKMLKPDGRLLIAIENKYGLKYWCGAPEDHTGVPFEGMHNYEQEVGNDRYGSSEVRTFSKQVITELFDAAGMPNHRFYYPLPDYKFPSVIFSDSYLPKEDDIRAVKFYYSDNSELVADEKKIYGEIIKNNCFPFFANSFFVEVSKTEFTGRNAKYASFKRDFADKYKVLTTIWEDDTVTKAACTPESVEHIMKVQHNAETIQSTGLNVLMSEIDADGRLIMPYSKLPLAVDYFNKVLRENHFSEAKCLLDLLKESLKQSSSYHFGQPSSISLPEKDMGEVLDTAYLDMIFNNIFYDNGKLVFFDQEWSAVNIPLKYILYRAIKFAQTGSNATEAIKERLYIEYGIDQKVRESFDRYETAFLSDKMDSAQCDLFDPMMYHEGLTIYPQSRKTVSRLYDELGQKDKIIIEKDAFILEKDNTILEKDNTILEKDNTIQEKDVQINNQRGHIDQLLQKERDYVNLLNSKGVRVLQVWWRCKDKMFPHGSKRRLIAKFGKKFLKHPIYMIKKCTPSRIARTLQYMKTEGAEGVSNRLDAATLNAGQEMERVKLDLFPVNEHMFSVSDVEKLQLPKHEKPLVSIVLPVYNQFHYTYNCLKSIIKYTDDIPYEVILADDCSTDLTKDIEQIVENIVVAKTPENMRFLRNCNHAAKYAKGAYIFFLNNDTQVQKDWLSTLLELMDRDEKIGMVGSMLLYPDGALQEAGGILWKDGSAWNYGNQKSPLDPEFNYVKEADYISGAAIMIRKSLWEEIGGFDDTFAPAYYEDTDLAFEVRKHGYKVMYQPLSKVVHFEGVSNGTDTSSGQKEYQIKNQKKFYEKWKDVLKTEHFPNGENVFLAKDRSRGKKQILVVDHYVPNHDKDAGGKCTFMYLQMFVKMGMKVTFIGDNFYPQQPYTQELNQMGIEVLYGNYYYNNWKQWLKDNAHYFDYIYLQRPHISIKYIDIVKEHSDAKILYFAHDLHHIRERREYELTGDEEKLKSSEKWKKIEYELFEKTDVGHVVGNYEQKIMQEAFPDTPVRNIPLYIYDALPEGINKDFGTRHNIMYVGGFGHPPNIDAVVWFGKEVFPKILKKYPDMVWYVAGGSLTEEVKALAGDNIKILGFVPDDKLEELYRTSRMAVVPLRVGAGVKGKVVESAYFQIPLVTTTIGAEGLDDKMGNMVVEDDADKMVDIICNLYEDFEQLRKMSDAGGEFIKKYFTEEEAKRVLLEDIEI